MSEARKNYLENGGRGEGGGGICMMIGYNNKTKVKYMEFAGKVPL